MYILSQNGPELVTPTVPQPHRTHTGKSKQKHVQQTVLVVESKVKPHCAPTMSACSIHLILFLSQFSTPLWWCGWGGLSQEQPGGDTLFSSSHLGQFGHNHCSASRFHCFDHILLLLYSYSFRRCRLVWDEMRSPATAWNPGTGESWCWPITRGQHSGFFLPLCFAGTRKRPNSDREHPLSVITHLINPCIVLIRLLGPKERPNTTHQTSHAVGCLTRPPVGTAGLLATEKNDRETVGGCGALATGMLLFSRKTQHCCAAVASWGTSERKGHPNVNHHATGVAGWLTGWLVRPIEQGRWWKNFFSLGLTAVGGWGVVVTGVCCVCEYLFHIVPSPSPAPARSRSAILNST